MSAGSAAPLVVDASGGVSADVALAEALGAPLATLDGRLARTKGVACPFLTWAP